MEPTRTEFMHLPGWQQALFYALAAISVAICGYQVYQRIRLWKRGKPIGWKPNLVANIHTYVLAQKKVRSSRRSSGAPMHLMIFYGFLALLLATTLLAINTYLPWKFHKGTYYLVYEMTFDLLGGLFVIGIGWAIVRRHLIRPPALTYAFKDSWALVLLFLVGITGYLLEAARMANNPQQWDSSAPIGYAMSQVLGTISSGTYVAIWWFHMLWVLIFFATIPQMRLKHILYAVASTAGKPDVPMGRLQPITMEEVEATGQIGVEHATDFSRWHLLSVDACMECGRCTEVCPAHGVGKSLNPKLIAQGVREALETGAPVAQTLTEDALWACTTCNACVEACPVTIRHVDLIVDARRHLVAEGKLSGTAAAMLRQVGSTGNSWGSSSDTREDWMRDLDIPLVRNGEPFDVLLWVGCAGATDPGAIKTTKAVAQLLQRAGVKFACLGAEERCTGDAARRVGDEFLFQEMAQQNIATFGKYGVKKIVTPCPHCMNTLRNEYGEFGGSYEVLHHTEMLSELVTKGQLRAAGVAESVVLHDPCYLGRVNEQTEAPRSLLASGLVEPDHRGQKTLCCGAGGGRMWMEEAPDERPGIRRSKELLATGAKSVAVACPFCRIMLDASIQQLSDDGIKLVDLAELLHQANSAEAVTRA